MVTTQQYLNRILAKLETTFDIEMPAVIGTQTYPALASFSSRSEKYVLLKGVTLWAADSFEYVLFLEEEHVTMAKLEEIKRLAADYMEPMLVRKGNKYPEKDHMYSYMTVVVLTEQTPDEQTVKAAKKLKLTRDYLLTIRGRSELHLVIADCSAERIFVNVHAQRHRSLYESVFREVHEGKKAYRV